MHTRLTSIVSLVVVIAALTAEVSAQEGNWPGWRGDGTGVSRETNLPIEWDAGRGVLWKKPLPGGGHSSPVVFGDRLLVTTAHERTDTVLTKLLLMRISVLLGLAVLAAMLVHAWRSLVPCRGDATPSPAWVTHVVRLEMLVAVSLGLYFLWKLAGLLLWESAEFNVESPHLTWIFSAEVIIFGLIASAGTVRAGSWSRLVATGLLAAATAAFHFNQPRGLANLAVPTEWQMNVLRAAAIAVAWFLISWIVVRLAGRPSRAASALVYATSGGLALLGLLSFGFFNFVEPRVGLWRAVTALDAHTGEEIWTQGVAAPSGRKYPTNSYASPTPATDGRYVVVNFGPTLVTMDFDGNVLWERREPLFMRYLRHGAAISPVIHKDSVLFAFLPETREAGMEDAMSDTSFESLSYLVALDLATGAERWRVDGMAGGRDAFGTPLLVPTSSGMSVLLSVNDHMHAYDADSGEHLWSVETPLHVPVPSVVANAETAFMSGGLYGPAVIAAVALTDVDGERATRSKRRAFRWKITRSTPEVSSPIIYGDLIYWVTQNGRMFCADPATGEIIWRQRLGGQYSASPVAGDGKLYIAGADGSVAVLQAGREYKEITRNNIDEVIYASPAIANGRIYIRGQQHLYAIDGN